MEFLLSSEHREISKVLTPFLAAEVSREKVRPVLDRRAAEGLFPAEQKALWKRFADLGVLGGMLPEEFGGLGMGLLSAAAVLEASQAPVHHLPIYQTLCHAILPLSLCAGSSAKSPAPVAELCEQITAQGRLASGIWLSEGEGLSVEAKKGGITLSGDCFPLSGGKEVEVLVLAVESSNSLEIYSLDLIKLAADGNAEAAGIEPSENLDLLRSYSWLHLKAAPVVHLGSVKDAAVILNAKHQQLVLAAAELAGLAKAAVSITVDYIKTREQFGHPIGSFQAVQHKMADMHLMSEQALALTRFAAWCSDKNDVQFQGAAVAAKGFASEAVPKVIEQAIQAHGGIGFTFEHDLHLYLRRSKVQAMLLGDAKEHYAALAEKALQSV